MQRVASQLRQTLTSSCRNEMHQLTQLGIAFQDYLNCHTSWTSRTSAGYWAPVQCTHMHYIFSCNMFKNARMYHI